MNPLNDHIGSDVGQDHARAGNLFEELRQDIGDDFVEDHGLHVDAQVFGRALGHRLQRLDHPVPVGEQTLASGQQVEPGLGGTDPLRRSLEETHDELPLQLHDGVTHRRLCHVQVLGSLRNRAGCDDGPEVLDSAKIHAACISRLR